MFPLNWKFTRLSYFEKIGRAHGTDGQTDGMKQAIRPLGRTGHILNERQYIRKSRHQIRTLQLKVQYAISYYIYNLDLHWRNASPRYCNLLRT